MDISFLPASRLATFLDRPAYHGLTCQAATYLVNLNHIFMTLLLVCLRLTHHPVADGFPRKQRSFYLPASPQPPAASHRQPSAAPTATWGSGAELGFDYVRFADGKTILFFRFATFSAYLPSAVCWRKMLSCSLALVLPTFLALRGGKVFIGNLPKTRYTALPRKRSFGFWQRARELEGLSAYGRTGSGKSFAFPSIVVERKGCSRNFRKETGRESNKKTFETG